MDWPFWRRYLAVGVLAAGSYFLLPRGSLVQTSLVPAVGLSAMAAVLIGNRIHRPAHPLSWLLLAAGLGCWFAGSIIWYPVRVGLHVELPSPSIADGLFLSGYPFYLAGMGMLIRRGLARRDLGAPIEAAIVTLGIGLLSWVFLIGPYSRISGLSLAGRLVAAAYPAMDLLLLAIVMRMMVRPGERNPASFFLVVGLVTELITDWVYLFLALRGGYDVGGPLDSGWLLFYVFVGAAALHPSMRSLSEPASRPEPVHGRSRLALLAASAVIGPVTIAVHSSRAEPVDLAVLAGISGLIFVLVLARMSGLMVDVAQYQRAQAQLRAAEERYRGIFENAVEGIFQTTMDGRYLSVNPALARMMGYESPQELMSVVTDVRALYVDPRQREEFIRRVDEGGMVTGFEYPVYRKDGAVIWVSENARPLLDVAGAQIGFEGTSMNITERRKAEEALRREGAIVELLQVVAVAANEATTVEEALQTCLDRICAHTQWPVGHAYLLADDSTNELIPTTLWHLDDPDRFDSFRRVTEATRFSPGVGLPGRVLTGGRPVWIVDVTKDKNFPRAKHAADIGVKAAFGFPVLVGAEVAGVLEFFSPEPAEPDDQLLEVMGHIGAQLGRVIERTRSEAELHQALQREHQAVEALRSLDEMKNAFLQAVSHDLRTPLTSILGAALTLERRDVNLSPAESHDLVQRLAANARRLDKLLSDLLDLDRLVRGIVAPNRRPTDVAALVRAVIEETDLLNEHEIQVDAKPVIAEVDAAKVERIVENLLINAVRHTPAGTMVWVRVREERSGVLITVEDAGTGVPEELREDIFQPFRQGPSPTSHSPGVGIGLSLVARFAELHGGWSRVGERPGGGASFQVFLPGSESKPAIGAFESRAGDGHQAQDAQEERISARRRG